MDNLTLYQYVLIGLVFVWSGIVRSSLGFGGAVLALPLLLLIYDQPLVFLPIISIHLLVFSSLIVYQGHRQSRRGEAESTVAWSFLSKALLIMFIPTLVGILGLITLPGKIMSIIIFTIISVYSLSYLFDRPFQSKSKLADVFFLILGAYVSGTSLIGAPIVIPVFAKYVSRYQLRDTLLALWFIIVAIKMASFIYAGIDLQLKSHLWLLPCAGLGHYFGLKLHRYLLNSDSVKFYRIIGAALLLTSSIGLYKALLS